MSEFTRLYSGSLFYFAIISVLSGFAIISLGKRELVALLNYKWALNVMSLYSLFESSSRCHGLVCSV